MTDEELAAIVGRAERFATACIVGDLLEIALAASESAPDAAWLIAALRESRAEVERLRGVQESTRCEALRLEKENNRLIVTGEGLATVAEGLIAEVEHLRDLCALHGFGTPCK